MKSISTYKILCLGAALGGLVAAPAGIGLILIRQSQ